MNGFFWGRCRKLPPMRGMHCRASIVSHNQILKFKIPNGSQLQVHFQRLYRTFSLCCMCIRVKQRRKACFNAFGSFEDEKNLCYQETGIYGFFFGKSMAIFLNLQLFHGLFLRPGGNVGGDPPLRSSPSCSAYMSAKTLFRLSRCLATVLLRDERVVYGDRVEVDLS